MNLPTEHGLRRGAGGQSALQNSSDQGRLQSLIHCVTTNVSGRILLAESTREVGLSPNRFAQSFNAYTRPLPHQFLMGLRLDRANRLPRDSKLNLTDVAQDCGSANQQHLGNSMQRVLGTALSSYRRSHKPSRF